MAPRKEQPEEQVVRALVRELRKMGYTEDDYRTHFRLKVQSREGEVDVALFARDDMVPPRHQQQNIVTLIECKRPGLSGPKWKEAQGQLLSYLEACGDPSFAILTDGSRREVYRWAYSRNAEGVRGRRTMLPEPGTTIPGPDHLEDPPPATLFVGRPAKPAATVAVQRPVQNAPASPFRAVQLDQIPAAQRPPVLYLLDGERRIRVLRSLLIGREPPADIMLKIPTVSRQHAAIEIRPGGYYLRDLGSREGIIYKGLRLPEEKKIEEGDVFYIAGFEMRFTFKRAWFLF